MPRQSRGDDRAQVTLRDVLARPLEGRGAGAGVQPRLCLTRESPLPGVPWPSSARPSVFLRRDLVTASLQPRSKRGCNEAMTNLNRTLLERNSEERRAAHEATTDRIMTCPRGARFGRVSIASWACSKRRRSRLPQRSEALFSVANLRAADADAAASDVRPELRRERDSGRIHTPCS